MVRQRLVMALGSALLCVGFAAAAANAQFFGNRQLVAEGVRWAPSLTPDGLELYYTNGENGNWEAWRMTRDSVDGEWLTDDFVDELNSSGGEDGFTFSADGLSVVFSSTREATRYGDWDLWQSHRSDREAPWEEPVPLQGVNLNTEDGAEATPSLSPDGLTLLFSSHCCGAALPRPGSSSRDIWYTTRTSTQSNEWSEPQIHPISSPTASDSNPSFSPDGLSLYFVSDRVGGYGDFDLYVATRKSLDEGFGEPLNLGPLVNGRRMDFSPHIGPDGFLYYIPDSEYGNVNVGLDIWTMSPFTPRPGDFNGDDQLTVEDIDLWVQGAQLFRSEQSRQRIVGFDLNDDGAQDEEDLAYWIRELKQTWIGDANLDGEFNNADLVMVLQAGRFATGGRSTGWNQGDWNGDRRFDRDDIILALQDGGYGQGSLAATQPKDVHGNGQASVIYDASSGELSLDALAGVELTSINIDSAAGIFTGDPAVQLGGRFDNDDDNNIFKATFGGSFGSLSFGNVTQAGLTEEFVLDDLTIIGFLAGGGDLGNVELVYVPEPTSVLLLWVGLAIGLVHFRRANR